MTDAPLGSPRPISTREDALAVVQRLRDAGHVAYFAGGCVRDELLGMKPKDYDVATDAPPQAVRRLFSNTSAVGAKFGVILVRIGQSQVEVATFRREGLYEDGRRPSEVHFTTAEEDARRRDFTINGMFFDPIENRVIDYVGGQKDLKAKVLRAIGDPNQRFEEDHLRLLRAVRFAARFGLTIEPATSAAIKIHAHQLKFISPERIAEELRLMLAKPDDTWAWHAIRVEFPQIAEVIFRFADSTPAPCPLPAAPNIVDALPTLENPFGVWLAAMSLEWLMSREESRELREMLSAANIRRMVRALRQSLRISNDEADVMHDSLEGVAILLRPAPLSVAVAKRFLARPTAMGSRHLLIALKCQVGAAIVDEIQTMLDRTAQTDFAPPPLITGDELISHGLKPGPMFKRILHDVYDAQLESRISTKEQAQELALKLAREAKTGQ